MLCGVHGAEDWGGGDQTWSLETAFKTGLHSGQALLHRVTVADGPIVNPLLALVVDLYAFDKKMFPLLLLYPALYSVLRGTLRMQPKRVLLMVRCRRSANVKYITFL